MLIHIYLESRKIVLKKLFTDKVVETQTNIMD